MDGILNAPATTSVTKLKSFLGLLSNYGKFIPKLSSTLYPLYELLKTSAKWRQAEEKEKCFHLAKWLLLSSNVLIHFDPTLDLLLSCDASEYAISTSSTRWIRMSEWFLYLVHYQKQNGSYIVRLKRRHCSACLESNDFTHTS